MRDWLDLFVITNFPQSLAEPCFFGGYLGFESGTWQGLLVPAATPPAVVSRLATELTKIIRSPDIRSRLTGQGAEVYTMSPSEFVTFFEGERKRWAGVVAKSGVKLD